MVNFFINLISGFLVTDSAEVLLSPFGSQQSSKAEGWEKDWSYSLSCNIEHIYWLKAA